MKFIDEIVLFACSGSGGNGVVRWNNLRNKSRGGPAGGDGGKGGDVYVRGVRDIALLSKYRGSNKFIAKDGEVGGGASLHGKDGEDMVIDLPVGSLVNIKNNEDQIEITKDGEMALILKGGKGGKGNEHFRSSRNVAPKEQTNGKDGECSELHIELRLIADLGLVGFPNAGKSSLLNSLTRAHAKVGDYQFTTLDPNLGDMSGYIIADIPGLIEGASEGRGLGGKFLRHLMRTNTLLHCISVERESLRETYSAVRAELEAYDKALLKKKEIIILTKADLVSQAELEKLKKEVLNLSDVVFAVSILDDNLIKNLRDKLIRIL